MEGSSSVVLGSSTADTLKFHANQGGRTLFSKKLKTKLEFVPLEIGENSNGKYT